MLSIYEHEHERYLHLKVFYDKNVWEEKLCEQASGRF